ncbi:Ig-like domain-containing protein, partial [Synechococcus sp. CS-1328]|uniref:Ig-like domain-containing protein n=1 Tax=Synechococcus sp. CS-1328 TaxID=2847976 RepID=UPI00223BE3DC
MAISTIGFEQFATELTPSQTSGIVYINGGSSVIDGVGFDPRIRVVGNDYRVAAPDGPVYGIPHGGQYFISNAEAETDDILLSTSRVLVESWFGRNEFYGFGGGASAITITAFGASGDLASVSVDLPDTFPGLADPTVMVDSRSFLDFAGEILGYRINRVAIGAFGGQWVADDLRFVDAADVVVPAAPLITIVSDDQGTIQGPLVSGATTDDATPIFSGTAEPGSSVALFDGGVSLGSRAAVAGNGSWSLTPAAALADGSHSVTAIATNAVGLSSGASNVFALTVETTPPAAPVITAAGDDQGIIQGPLVSGATTDDAIPIFSGTAEPGSSVALFDGGVSLGSTTAAAGNG